VNTSKSSVDPAELDPENTLFPSTSRGVELPGILIYAPHLLPMGQNYVREHAVRMQRYRPVLAGRRRVQGVSVDDFPNFTLQDGGLSKFQELRYMLTGANASLNAFVAKHRIQLIHAHFGPGAAEIMPLASRLNIPLVVTFHGWDLKVRGEQSAPVSPYERLYRWRLPRLLRQATEIICVSENWRHRILTFGCKPEKVRTNYLGIDSTFFDGNRGQFDPDSIIYVGRLIRRKGVHNLLEAVRILRDRGVRANLTIVGEGPESEKLKATVAAQNLPVTFLGKKDPAQIRELLRFAAVLCAPSTTAEGEMAEALGLVLLESQAMGVPVVGTRNGGIPETFVDGETGYLVDQESTPALADALGKLLGNEPVNRAFGQRARAFICDRFDIARSHRSLEQIYDSILERNP
jgi:colanic acid/amylovoran biosynthesis glycosyltransferase